MTNGEKIKAMFPSMEVGFITESQIGIYFVKNQHYAIVFDIDWWNAEYKEPTTKNDLGVDCISRDAVKYYIQAHIHEIITESGIDKNAHTNRVLRALLNGVDTMPSVTPQPCEDTISRVDAINCLAGQIELNPSDVPAVNEYLKGVDKRLHELSSVTPQSRWIPVSERLPEEDTDVLVTLKCGLIGIMQKKLADDDYGEPCYIWQDFEGEEHEVIAWMPLPAPYKADRSEEE